MPGNDPVNSTNVLICAENPSFAHGLESAIEQIEDFQVVGVALDGKSLQGALSRSQTDVLVLDTIVLARSGSELLELVERVHPATRVIFVGEDPSGHDYAVDRGVLWEALPIDASIRDWSEALRRARRGNVTATRDRDRPQSYAAPAKEIVAIALLLAFSAYLVRDMFSGEFILTGYADWVFHAYRIRSLQEYGFLTWTNDWGGGFPLWQSYQFVPHLATLALRLLAGWSITKSMVFVTGLLFVVLRVGLYVGLRRSGFSVPAAFISSLLTIAMTSYYIPLLDFSYLWGVTLFPFIVLLLAGQTGTLRRLYLTSLLIGLGIYVHALVAVVGTIALVCNLITSKDHQFREAMVALAITFLAASFFWFPTLFAEKPSYLVEWELSTQFMRFLFPTHWLGLSPSLVGVVLGILILGSTRFPLAQANPRLFATIAATLGTLLVTIALTYAGLTPETVNQLEPTRWMGFAGTLLSMLGAFVVGGIKGRHLRPAILALAVLYIAADGFVIARNELRPIITYAPESRIVQTINEDEKVTYDDLIVTSSGLVPEMSFFNFGRVRMAGNYFGAGALDILYPALTWLLLSDGDGSTLQTGDPTLALAYMKAVGGTLFVVPDTQPVARAFLPGGSLAGAMQVRHQARGFVLFEAPGNRTQAIITSPEEAASVHFPDIKYDTDEQRKQRDGLVLRLARTIDDPKTIVPDVRYPSQTEIKLSAPDVPPGRLLIVFAPYDSAWEVHVNGVRRAAQRAGPNYVGVNISDTSGNVEVELKHGVHWTWIAGGALTCLGLALFAAKFFGCSLGFAASAIGARSLEPIR